MDDATQQSQDDIKKDLHRLQSQLIAHESDLQRKVTEKSTLDMDIARLKRTVATARAEREEKEEIVKKIARDISFLEEEVMRTKKKFMNARAQHRAQR